MKKITFNNISKIENKYIYEYHAKTRGLFRSKKIKIWFIANFPHYTLRDILWMTTSTNNEEKLLDLANIASSEWCNELDIQIGKITLKETNKVNLSSKIIDRNVYKQQKLKEEWSKETSMDYPEDLNIIKV